MDLLKLYIGKDDHRLSLYHDAGRFYYTDTFTGLYLEKGYYKKLWRMLDIIDLLVYERPSRAYKAMPLLRSCYQGNVRRFESVDDFEQFYTGLGVDVAHAVDCVKSNIPLVFGDLQVHLEPSRRHPQQMIDQYSYIEWNEADYAVHN